jgi:hypothetical protein
MMRARPFEEPKTGLDATISVARLRVIRSGVESRAKSLDAESSSSRVCCRGPVG